MIVYGLFDDTVFPLLKNVTSCRIRSIQDIGNNIEMPYQLQKLT